jgi:hypothetical protein
MTIKDNEHCYATLLGKINSLDNQISRVKDQINELKKIIGSRSVNDNDIETKHDINEICLENASELITKEDS